VVAEEEFESKEEEAAVAARSRKPEVRTFEGLVD
jgi:hypothetical protein